MGHMRKYLETSLVSGGGRRCLVSYSGARERREREAERPSQRAPAVEQLDLYSSVQFVQSVHHPAALLAVSEPARPGVSVSCKRDSMG